MTGLIWFKRIFQYCMQRFLTKCANTGLFPLINDDQVTRLIKRCCHKKVVPGTKDAAVIKKWCQARKMLLS